jgi:sporulation protein YlmC with PRC-barrel domain
VSDQAIRESRGFDRSNWDFDGTDRRAGSSRQGLWQASRLLGRDVADRNDDHLGEIKDLVIDGRSGQVQYVVMRYDRPWSLDNPLVAVPLHSLRFGGDQQQVSMNVDRHEVDTQRTAGGMSSSPDLWIERWFVLVPQDTSESATGSKGADSNVAGRSEFGRLDTDGDGSLSQAEYDAATRAMPAFANVDRNANKSVSRDEFASMATSGSRQ